MLLVTKEELRKQESVSLVTTRTNAKAVTPELGLVQAGITMTVTRVEMNMDGSCSPHASKSRGTSWCSKRRLEQRKYQALFNIYTQMNHTSRVTVRVISGLI